jgi:hypothetical protein
VDVFLNDRPSGGNGFTLAYTFGATGGYYGSGFEGAAILDVDHDGWLDVFVSEGSTANWLLANPADGTLDFTLDYVIETKIDQARGQVLVRSREWVVRPVVSDVGEPVEVKLDAAIQSAKPALDGDVTLSGTVAYELDA